jgi:hypothetical protein
MSILDQIVTKARGEERQRFELAPPPSRCPVCDGGCFMREPDQPDWSCVGCDLRAGRKWPPIDQQAAEGWQGAVVE